MKKVMVSPENWISVNERFPKKNGPYYAISGHEIFEISVVTANNIAFFLLNPEKFNKKLFKGIREPKWYRKEANGTYTDVTDLITYWLNA